MFSKLFCDINFKVLTLGLLLFIFLTIVFYYVQYANFMVEVSRLGKEFSLGGKEVFTSIKTMSIEYFCVFIAYGASALYVSKKAIAKPIKNTLTLGFLGGVILGIYSILFNQEFIKVYYLRFFLEWSFGIFVCLMIGLFFRKNS